MRPIAFIAITAILNSIALAQPMDTGPVGFRSPTGNIHCLFISGGPGEGLENNHLRCDIKKVSNGLPKAPPDCDLDWGQAFEVSDDGKPAERLCHGDTATDDRLPVLHYGQKWERKGFECRSEKTGVTCTSPNKNGFSLSRSGQKLF